MHRYALLTFALTFNAFANVLIKAGMRHVERLGADAAIVQRFVLNPYLWGGVACFGVALAFYALTLAKMPLSIAYPLMTTVGFAIVLTASAFLFDERLNAPQWVGIGLIVSGVWLAARG